MVYHIPQDELFYYYFFLSNSPFVLLSKKPKKKIFSAMALTILKFLKLLPL